MKYPIHPAADAFPMIGSGALTELSQDIRKNGLLEPVKLWQGQILDGRNRSKACEIACVEPRYEEVVTSDPVAYVISANIHRRHLTTQQRAAVGAELANMTKQDTLKQNTTDVSNDTTEKVSTQQAADMMDVSKASVDRAKKRMKDDPAAHEAAKRGEKVKAQKKPKAPKYQSWISIIKEAGVISGNPGSSSIDELKAEILKHQPAVVFTSKGVSPDDAVLVRGAADKMALSRTTSIETATAKKEASSVSKELSKTAQEKLEAAIRAHKKAVDMEYELLIQERVTIELQIMLDDYNKANAMHKRVVKAYKGPLSVSEYKSLRSLIHPDKHPNADDVMKARLEKMFHIISEREL